MNLTEMASGLARRAYGVLVAPRRNPAEPQRLGKMGGSLLPFTQPDQRHCEFVMRSGIVSVQPQRLPVLPGGFLHPAQFRQHPAQVVALSLIRL